MSGSNNVLTPNCIRNKLIRVINSMSDLQLEAAINYGVSPEVFNRGGWELEVPMVEIPETLNINKLSEQLNHVKKDLIDNQEEKLQHLKRDLMKEINVQLGRLQDKISAEIAQTKCSVSQLDKNLNRKTQELENMVNSFKTKMNKETEKENLSTNTKKIENLVKNIPLDYSDVILDTKIIIDFLPEFQGKLEEDPKQFISRSTSLLKRTNLPEEIYVNILAKQLKSSAAVWWENVKGLDLDWEDFQKELFIQFDSEAIKANVITTYLTETQSDRMQADVFVIKKIQLHRRLHPQENRNMAVPYIVELLNDKLKSSVKMAKPDTVEDLREVIRRLEEEHTYNTGKSNASRAKHRRSAQDE